LGEIPERCRYVAVETDRAARRAAAQDEIGCKSVCVLGIARDE
jgi:hypothetical protein